LEEAGCGAAIQRTRTWETYIYIAFVVSAVLQLPTGLDSKVMPPAVLAPADLGAVTDKQVYSEPETVV